MKIKAVCEATGLTDRTVRYYIEEALVSPEHTDNYWGRRNYDFSEEDVQRLKDIAVLRKFGASVSEIREMIHSSGNLYPMAQELRARKCAAIDEERKLVDALDRLDHLRFYTFPRLADALSEPVEEAPMPSGDEKRSIWSTVWDVIKKVVTFVLVGIPVVWAVFVFWIQSHSNYYPVFRLGGVLLTLLFLSPSIAYIIISRTGLAGKVPLKWKRRILVVLVLSTIGWIVAPFGIISHSETTDIRNYGDFDPSCSVNGDDLFRELFPHAPNVNAVVKQSDGSYETVRLDTRYLYRHFDFIDPAYDVYAEWPLEEEAFQAEIDRVRELFQRKATVEDGERPCWNYVTVEKGDYDCHILAYHDDPIFEGPDGSAAGSDHYRYYIFAYEEARHRVRYLCCYSMQYCDGDPGPYYLELEW
ncbi:MAG: MerR family transcriptional regulator [Oscillospiraceae bacterium]|nr:MerR family transcriptional regulator [Oscillospiraceae bacterium]